MRLRVVVVLGLVVATAAAIAAWHFRGRQDRPPPAGSVGSKATTTKERGMHAGAPARRVLLDWPTYGRNAARTHAAPFRVRPPFKRLWAVYGDSSFIEFPPIVTGGRLFFATDRGRVAAIDTRTGAVLWNRELGHCVASSLAATGDAVIVGAMGPPPCHGGRGELVALDRRSGKTRWRFVAGPIESSPLVVGDQVIVGSWDGKLYSLSVRTGRLRWSFTTEGPIKGGPALAGRAPPGSEFYATPTVAYRRVFIGATNGIVYAYAAGSGQQLWSRSLGSFVYSPAAVANRHVFIGSYNHRLYALAASSGRVLWSFESRGPVSGAPTVLERLVYFSSCGSCSKYESNPDARRTYAVDTRTGRLMWSFPDGEYSPVVSDGTRLYLTGYTTVYGLAPRGS